MGPREVPPPLPGLEATLSEKATVAKYLRDCSWLQGFEGDLDTTHIGFLHFGAYKAEDMEPGSMDYYALKRRDPKMMVVDTPWGATYGSYRPAEADTTYWRVAQYLYPFYAMPPVGVLGARVAVLAIVPVDDTHMMRWQISVPSGWAMSGAIAPAYKLHPEYGYLPATSGFLGAWRMKQNKSNDYLLDRDFQKNGSFTGIMGIGIQDEAVTESMGAIMDRSKEHLGTSDLMVIRLRQLLLRNARRLREHGEVPPAVDTPEVYAVRSGGVVLPHSIENGIAATLDLQQGRVKPDEFGLAPLVENHGV